VNLSDLPPDLAAIARAQLGVRAGTPHTEGTPHTRRRGRTPEGVVLRDCLKTLEAWGIEHQRNNTGAAKIGRRLIKFGKKGSSDLLAVLPPHGQLMAVEVKAPGKKPTKLQQAYLERVAEAGGLAIVIDDVGSLGMYLRRLYPGRG
jgi:hypothetical protein